LLSKENCDDVQSIEALSEKCRYLLSLQGETALVVEADSSSAALATVTSSIRDAPVSVALRVVAPVLNELRGAGERGLHERTPLDTVDELQAWAERAVMTTHFRFC
jgi:hypothetical protein